MYRQEEKDTTKDTEKGKSTSKTIKSDAEKEHK